MTDLIVAVKQKKPYEHPYGDIIYGEYSDFIRKAKKKNEIGNMNALFLGYFSIHKWKALGTLPQFKFDANDKCSLLSIALSAEYECPYTNRVYRGLLPYAIFSDDVEKYFSHYEYPPYFKEMACDKEWNVKPGLFDDDCGDDEDEGIELSNVDQLILGSGYTDFCGAGDGSYSIVPVIIDLSNGDKLYCFTLVWHNK